MPLEGVEHSLPCFCCRLTRFPAFAERRPQQRTRGDDVRDNRGHNVLIHVLLPAGGVFDFPQGRILFEFGAEHCAQDCAIFLGYCGREDISRSGHKSMLVLVLSPNTKLFPVNLK
jgi:hypothetical protein